SAFTYLAPYVFRVAHLPESGQRTPPHHHLRRRGVYPQVPPARLARGLHESPAFRLSPCPLRHPDRHSPPADRAGTPPRLQAVSERPSWGSENETCKIPDERC